MVPHLQRFGQPLGVRSGFGFPCFERMRRIVGSGHADRRRSTVYRSDRPTIRNGDNSEHDGGSVISRTFPGKKANASVSWLRPRKRIYPLAFRLRAACAAAGRGFFGADLCNSAGLLSSSLFGSPGPGRFRVDSNIWVDSSGGKENTYQPRPEFPHAGRGENAGSLSEIPARTSIRPRGRVLCKLLLDRGRSGFFPVLSSFPAFRNQAAAPIRFRQDFKAKQGGQLGEAPAEQQFHILGRDIELFAHELPEMLFV